MKGAKILLAVSAVLAVVVSLMLLFATSAFLAPQGIPVDDKVALLGQAQGSILLGVGAINLLALRTSDPAGLRAVLGGNLVTHLAAIGVNVHAIAAHLVTQQVWGDLVMHAVFAALFALFLVRVARLAPA